MTRPDIVRSVHSEYFDAGVDCVETNTFGANLTALGEYDIPERVAELSEAGARIARETADEFAARDGRQRWVLGSIGPGTKLPTLGHTTFDVIRDAYQQNAEGLLAGGADALLVETTQDLLQTKASVLAARRAMETAGYEVPLIVSVTVETTGTMLLGSEIGAALTALEPLGIDMIGLNCATGPAEMSEHLRYLARHSRVQLSCMPNAGLPVLGQRRRPLPAHGAGARRRPGDLRTRLRPLPHRRLLRHHPRASAPGRRAGPRYLAPTERHPQPEPGAASLYQTVPFRQDTSYLAIGERTNANGSKKFRDAMLDGRWDDCVEMARDQIREGAHMLDLCVDYVGRDGVADMEELAGRFATASTLPIVLDSTEVPVIRAGLEKLGGRAVINSVNYEDGDGPESRFAKVTSLAQEHGAALIALTIDEVGQARTPEKKVEIAERLIEDLTGNWGIHESDILIDTLTFTICTGQEESRKDGVATIEAIRELKRRHPDVQTTLGLSNISFGLNPAARILLNSVFLDECVKAGLDSAIVHASKILPIARFSEEEVQTALDLIHDRRAEGYDPLQKLMALFEGATTKSLKAGRAEELAALPLDERLKRRIIDGEKNGLEADLDEALSTRKALDIVNETLLDGMKVVGELFGSGQMQLPFVLQSAEVMKTAVAHLEPHMEKSDDEGKGTIVLATVRGDVHDIGKNLVDIILSNNGYNVVNLGIKQPVSAILDAAEEHRADVIGMSGLLVKSTVIMKENLEELNQRGLAADFPVILGGAALTRAYVEQDLHEIYEGEVRYARDAFEGLRLMDALIGVKRGVPGAKLPELKQRRVRASFGRRGRGAPGGGPRPLRRRHRQPHPRPALLGHPRHQGHPAQGVRELAGRGRAVQGPVGSQAGPHRRGADVRGAGRDRGPAAAARSAGPAADRQPAGSGRRLRLLPVRLQGRRPDHPGRARQRTHPLHLPAPAPRPQAVPRRLLPPSGGGGDRRRRPPGRHRRFADRRGDGADVRGERLPRLPRTARPVGAVGRGARRVLARTRAVGARLRR